jgi:hypothetical protein
VEGRVGGRWGRRGYRMKNHEKRGGMRLTEYVREERII